MKRMYQKDYLILLTLTLVLSFIPHFSKGQDSLKIREIQTYFPDGSIKSIESRNYNEIGKISRITIFNKKDNDLITIDTKYDSLDRPIKKISSQNNVVTDSTLFEYSADGLTTETRYDLKHFYGTFYKNVIVYNQNGLPQSEFEYSTTDYSNIDTKSVLISISHKFYDDQSRLIIDSTYQFNNNVRWITMNGQHLKRFKTDTATVTTYSYENQFLASSERISDFGEREVVNHIRNKKGDHLRLERINMTLNDTINRIEKYDYDKVKGYNVQTINRGIPGMSISKVYFDKNGKVLKKEEVDDHGNLMSLNEYVYDARGYLTEEKFTVFLAKKPINYRSNEPLGFRRVYLYE